MSQLGLGAMLHYLGGGSPHRGEEYAGRKIVSADFTDKALTIGFSDGVTIKIWDNGQSCCENRYMTTDDDVQSLVGHRLRHIEAKPGPGEPCDYDEHETAFIEVATDDGHITVTTHNEHNGYYGGFGLAITETTD